MASISERALNLALFNASIRRALANGEDVFMKVPLMPPKTSLRSLAETDELYAAALAAYLRLGDEDCLHRGYELGRRAVREERSILQMIEMHQRALAQVVASAGSCAEGARAVKAASAFFGEAMSPFEMTNRAFGEANAALEHVNELLESEVKRIAHRLHDGTGQLLAAAHIALEDIGHDMPAPTRERLQEVRRILDQVETELRGLSHELSPPTLAQGLASALQVLAAAVSRRTGLRVVVENVQAPLPSKTQIILYRVIQEALKNVAKHAKASCAIVSLSVQDGFICCSIEDDGAGFDKNVLQAGPGLGLLCIRERLQALYGCLEIQSAIGLGTKLSVRIPM